MADALDDAWWEEDNQGTEKSGKRKNASEDVQPSGLSVAEPAKKKRKRKKKNLTEELAEKKVVDARKEFLLLFEKFCEKNVLGMEKAEFAVKESHLVDLCSDVDTTPSDRLVQMVPKMMSYLKRVPTSNGCPAVIVIAGSALRVIELAKNFSRLSEGMPVAKLFAKHKKVSEHKELLSDSAMKIAVGTPKRILDLLDLDLLSLTKLKVIVLDWHFRDLKLRRLVDTPQIREDTMGLLKKHLLFKVFNHFVRVVLL